MAAHKEGKIERYLVEQVEKHGGLCRKAKWLCRRGAPDRFVAFPKGRYGFVEVKAPGKPLDAHQAREIERLRRMDVSVGVVDNYDAVDMLIAKWSTTP